MGSSNPFKAVVKAIAKVVRVIVKVVKFVVKAVVNFVKGVIKGDVGSIIMLVAVVFTFGAALGFWCVGMGITMGYAVTTTAFALLGTEYQRQKAEKMQRAAEADLLEQAANEEDRMTNELVKKNEAHFDRMENQRYKGYESGSFGIGTFEPDGILPSEPRNNSTSSSVDGVVPISKESTGKILLFSLLGGFVVSNLLEG